MASFSSHYIIPELKIIVTQHQGRLTMTELIRSTKLFMADDKYDASYNVFVDFRDSIAMSFRLELLEMVDFVKKNVKLPHQVKICAIYSSPNQDFLLTLYKPIARMLSMDVEKFKDLEAGLTWLGFDAEQSATVSQSLVAIKSPDFPTSYGSIRNSNNALDHKSTA